MRMLTHEDVQQYRYSLPSRAALLYITDRCPVGCAHCSVSAEPMSASPDNAAVFSRVLDAIAKLPLDLVGISGGGTNRRTPLPNASRQLPGVRGKVSRPLYKWGVGL